MIKELHECPFCGKTTSLKIYTDKDNRYGVECTRCRYSTRTYKKISTAIHKWNTRDTEFRLTRRGDLKQFAINEALRVMTEIRNIAEMIIDNTSSPQTGAERILRKIGYSEDYVKRYDGYSEDVINNKEEDK
jgi:Lar family restriction alleviation protein